MIEIIINSEGSFPIIGAIFLECIVKLFELRFKLSASFLSAINNLLKHLTLIVLSECIEFIVAFIVYLFALGYIFDLRIFHQFHPFNFKFR